MSLRMVDRYILREILVPFGMGLGLFFAVVSFAQLLKVADSLTGVGISGGDLLAALCFSLPPLLGLLIPVSSLFATLLGVGRLACDRELLALSAAGLSPARLFAVPLALGLILAVLSGTAMAFGEPWGIAGLRNLMARGAQRTLAKGVRTGEFHEWVPGVTLYAARRHGSQLQQVIFADRRNPNQPLVVSAATGELHQGARPEDLLFVMQDGDMLLSSGPGEAVPTTVPTALPSPGPAAVPTALPSPGPAAVPTAVRSPGPAAVPVAVLPVVDDEIPPVQEDRLIHFERGVYRLDVGGLVGNKARNLSLAQEMSVGQLWRQSADPAQSLNSRGLLLITLHRKFAVPLAAVIFSLLAVPLGMRSSSAARARGFLLSTAIVAAYYYIGRAAELSARSGHFPPGLAAWLPNLLGLATFMLLLVQLRRTPR